MEDCIFCRIVRKELPSTIIYEDDGVVAFNDINPEAPIHVLIVPRQHITSVAELDESNKSVVADVHVAAVRWREAGNQGRGFRLVSNCGPDAGQSVIICIIICLQANLLALSCCRVLMGLTCLFLLRYN